MSSVSHCQTEVSKGFPVFRMKHKGMLLRQQLAVPLINKDVAGYNPWPPAPTMGMQKGAVIVAKPWDDPRAGFAIMLFDPTVDDISDGRRWSHGLDGVAKLLSYSGLVCVLQLWSTLDQEGKETLQWRTDRKHDSGDITAGLFWFFTGHFTTLRTCPALP